MLAAKAIRRFFTIGHLTVIDTGGRTHEFAGTDRPRVTVRLRDNAVLRRLLFNPELAVGEAWMDGGIEIVEGTLYDFLDLCIANSRAIEQLPLQRFLNRFRGVRAAIRNHNPIRSARRKVSHHYDLKDELFDLFLDSDRQYSCAYFPTPDADIETAQYRKKLHLAAKLLLQPGQLVLDIGSGWGGLGMFLAESAGVGVEGCTLSDEQHRVSNDRAAARGLAERVRFNLQDYRALGRRYDRIVSVGMLEHVGPRHYHEFYGKVAELLADDGVAVIHCIGKFNTPGPQNAWMEKYIFPGAYVPTLAEQLPAIERAGLLVTDLEVLRVHYAETLRCWREAFYRNIDRVRAMYDERFCRMWDFYLTGCELAFRHGLLMVFQFQLARSLMTVPLTRDYIHEYERDALRRLRDGPALRETGD